jgi:hypothetical protein
MRRFRFCIFCSSSREESVVVVSGDAVESELRKATSRISRMIQLSPLSHPIVFSPVALGTPPNSASTPPLRPVSEDPTNLSTSPELLHL